MLFSCFLLFLLGGNQISYSSTSPRLSRKADFPLFARVVPSEKLTHLALLELFRSFGWRRIATIHELSDVFSGVSIYNFSFGRGVTCYLMRVAMHVLFFRCVNCILA